MYISPSNKTENAEKVQYEITLLFPLFIITTEKPTPILCLWMKRSLNDETIWNFDNIVNDRWNLINRQLKDELCLVISGHAQMNWIDVMLLRAVHMVPYVQHPLPWQKLKNSHTQLPSLPPI